MLCGSLSIAPAWSRRLAQSEARVILQRVEGVLIVPLPDPMHDAFLDDLRISVLEYMRHHRIAGLILDLSGVEVLDEHDFERIRRVADGVTLMGAPVVLAGMKPGVAAGLVMLDINDAWVIPSLSVESAMERLR
jgi:rsbT antagonist protein RsbS